MKIAIKCLLIYLTVIGFFVAIMLFFNINEILYKRNYILLGILLIMVFTVLLNTFSLFKKTTGTNYKYVLLYNSLFCFFFSFRLRLCGWLINNLIGTQVSFYSFKNKAGSDSGVDFEWFNVALVFNRYNSLKNIGYLIQVNLFMVLIGVILLTWFVKLNSIPRDNVSRS
jgi:hypothetical protein